MVSLIVYEHQFVAKCPVNGKSIVYDLTIETSEPIMVEDIIAACKVAETLHEPLAENLFSKFGGAQKLSAEHHGVKITTFRA